MSDEVSSWMKIAEVNYEKWWWSSSNEILTLLNLENRFSTVLRSIRSKSFIQLFQTRFGQNAERRRTRCRSLHPTKVHRLQPTYRRQGTVFLGLLTITRLFRTSLPSSSTSAMSIPSPALCWSRTPPSLSAALSAEWANLMIPSTDSPEKTVLPSKFGLSAFQVK